MNKDEVKTTVDQLLNAFKGSAEDETAFMSILVIGGMATNLARIADSLEKLASFEVEKIGELLHVGPVYTPDEIETLEALRKGDLKVVVVHKDPNTDPKLDGFAWHGVDGQPPVEPYEQVEVWALGNTIRAPASEIDWIGAGWSFWRRVNDWIEWDGMNPMGPPLRANVLVDIRFRTPSHGERAPDMLNQSPVAWNWQNQGRPTNADIVAYRISEAQYAIGS